MAQYTRIYTYTKGDGWSTDPCSLALTQFTVTGETEKPINKIVSVTARYACNQTTSANIVFRFRLAISGVEYFGESDTYSGVKARWLTQSLTDIPAGSLWVESNIEFKANVNYTTTTSARNKVSWEGSSDRPITLTLVYESESLKPSIPQVDMHRCDANGADDDSGAYVAFNITVTAEQFGGTGTLKIYKAGTAVYTGNSFTLTEATVIKGYGISQAIGDNCSYTIEFVYKMTIDGSEVTETAPGAAFVTKVKTNVHLSGCSTGGLRCGSYSRSTEDNPLFECDYPVYAYGGIMNISCGTTTQASHANGTEETVKFGVTYQEAPIVLVSINGNASGSAFGGCFVAVKSVTTTGFTLRYANTSGSTRTFAVNWLAYGLISEVV